MDGPHCSDIDEGFTLLGPAARHACEAVVERMAFDAALRARVDARHALMANTYAEEHPDATLEQARRAGRRAYLFALLIESGYLRSSDNSEAQDQ